MRKLSLKNVLGASQESLKKVNYIMILNDRSGSMRDLHGKVTEETTKKLQEIKAQAEKTGINTLVCVADFSNKMCVSEWGAPPVYTPRYYNDGTNLYASVARALTHLTSAPVNKGADIAYLLLVMTDGRNEPDIIGKSVSEHNLAEVIKDLPENVTITIAGPPSTDVWAKKIGIPPDNIIIWDGVSSESYGQTMRAQTLGLGNYYATRGAGGSSTQSFYTVNPNKLQPEELAKLKKLSVRDFAYHTNSKPKIELKPFVESCGYKFLKGANYYQLLKPEKIQENKDILIQDENGDVYGNGNNGADIRRFLGLPTTGTILVHPVVGKYTIFVQSNSNNRKLISWTDKKTGKKHNQKVIILR